MTEFKKDIFRYNNQDQLEMGKLNSFSGANKIEFKPNDGIYVNGAKLSGGGGGAPVGNTRSVTMTGPSAPASTTITGIPIGKTFITFSGASIDWIAGTTVELNYDPNPGHPFAGMNRVIPIFKTTGSKPNALMDTEIGGSFIFDKIAETFVYTVNILGAGGTAPLSSFVIELDFVYT